MHDTIIEHIDNQKDVVNVVQAIKTFWIHLLWIHLHQLKLFYLPLVFSPVVSVSLSVCLSLSLQSKECLVLNLCQENFASHLVGMKLWHVYHYQSGVNETTNFKVSCIKICASARVNGISKRPVYFDVIFWEHTLWIVSDRFELPIASLRVVCFRNCRLKQHHYLSETLRLWLHLLTAIQPATESTGRALVEHRGQPRQQ